MRVYLSLFMLIIISSSYCQANNASDTINVLLNLKQISEDGLQIKVCAPANLGENCTYTFAKSVPGIYEYLNMQNSRTNFLKVDTDTLPVNSTDSYLYQIGNTNSGCSLTYMVNSTVNILMGISSEDFYYKKDSIFILNWHYLIGFFNNEINSPYKIIVTKNANLWGAGSLNKTCPNDTTDIYKASNFKELIHNPILYSIPDTISFKIDESRILIANSGDDTLLNAKKIKELLIAPLTEIINNSAYKHKEYTFLFHSQYSISDPGLVALEHPNSTLVCYHSALLDNEILISSAIHEFIHSVYAPLRIRSEIINNFNFTTPVCDEFLWFYEGTTEYLADRVMLNSGAFSTNEFLNELNLSNTYYKNINFSKVSGTIYGKKGQKQFDNFYTKGSLFALQLDVEIMKRSNGAKNLFSVMRELQKKYNPQIPFNSKNFINELAELTGIEASFFNKYINTTLKIDFKNLASQLGYTLTSVESDTLIWSFSPSKTYDIRNFRNNQLEVAFFGSSINKEQHCRKLTITKINNAPITWFNCENLYNPLNDNELELFANNGKNDILINSKPKQIVTKTHKTIWIKNENYNSSLAKNFWGQP